MNAAHTNNLSKRQTRHRPSAFGRRSLGTGRVAARPENLPPWQLERMATLQRACRSLKGRQERGEKLSQAGKRVARRYDGQPLKCDASRKLQLKPSTLRRLFRVWMRNGESSAAFRLNYSSRPSVFTSGILTRFIQFLVDSPQPSLAVAWAKFCERGGSFGPGRRGGKPLKISYYQIRYALPTELFQKIAAQQKAIVIAHKNLEQIQNAADEKIRVAYPERLPARRARRQADFQI